MILSSYSVVPCLTLTFCLFFFCITLYLNTSGGMKSTNCRFLQSYRGISRSWIGADFCPSLDGDGMYKYVQVGIYRMGDTMNGPLSPPTSKPSWCIHLEGHQGIILWPLSWSKLQWLSLQLSKCLSRDWTWHITLHQSSFIFLPVTKKIIFYQPAMCSRYSIVG